MLVAEITCSNSMLNGGLTRHHGSNRSTSHDSKSKKMGSIKQFFMMEMFFDSLSKYKMNENYSLSATLIWSMFI
jgi:hypothetical protein